MNFLIISRVGFKFPNNTSRSGETELSALEQGNFLETSGYCGKLAGGISKIGSGQLPGDLEKTPHLARRKDE